MNHKHWPLARNLVAFSSGFLFAVGLARGGMTQPKIVIDFLNVLSWNPTLLFVMAGALVVVVPVFRVVKKRKTPFFDSEFHFPTATGIDRQLIGGAVIFGVGWGIGGYCPGPAIASLASGAMGPIVFVAAMIVGIFLHKLYTKFN